MKRLVLLFVMCVAACCTAQTPAPVCIGELQRIYGKDIQVIRSGDLNHDGYPLTLAIIPLSGKLKTLKEGEIAAKRIFVARKKQSCKVIFDAGENPRNEIGYVGVEYLSHDPRYRGFALKSATRKTGLRFLLFWIFGSEIDHDAVPLDVEWNRNVHRLQSVSLEGSFEPEKRNPPDRGTVQ